MSPGFALRMAAREARAAPRRLALLAASIAIGVAALVAINGLGEDLRGSVRRQARALLGADLTVTSRRPIPPKVEALLDSLGTTARLTNFGAMAYVPRTTGSRLVQVSAVSGPYPLYGEVRTGPASAWAELQRGRSATVDPALLTALGARVGDTLRIGEVGFVITGTVVSAPGNLGFRSALGPRVFIPARYLDETRLLGVGARVEHATLLRLPAGRIEAVAERLRPVARAERLRLRTAEENREDLSDALARLTSYLGLVAFVALLLGGVGVASAVVVFVRQRAETVAVLRCLGATAGQVFAVYLLEAALLGLVGSVAGALGGLAVQQALPALLDDLLPVDLVPSIPVRAVATGIGTGLWASVVFALLPLLPVRRISPLAALRRPYEDEPRSRDPWRWGAALLLAGSALALAALQAGDWRRGAIFTGGVAAALLVLWLAARLLIALLRRRPPARWPYAWRQGLANLHRPSNQTATVVLALGFGAFLLGTLLLVQHNLLRRLRVSGGPARPNLVLFDIQPDQLDPVGEELRAAGLPVIGPVPIVPMRIQSIRGRPVSQLLADTLREEGGGWALRREYRSTYRDSLVRSERLVAGGWWERALPQGQATVRPTAGRSAPAPVPISVEEGVARELGVGLADEIVWDVQGVPLPSRVASLREVEWARFEPNFFVVFAPGALERAPQSFVLLTRIEAPTARGALQRHLAERYANVSALDLTVLQETLERLLARVALAVRSLALFTLATGTLVLIGALATSRLQRIREGALLRALGATRRQILRVALAEYLALGLLAVLASGALASVAGWALARFLFEHPFSLPLPALAGLALGLLGLTVGVGLANTRAVVTRPPLEVLREE